METTRLITITEWSDYHPWPTTSGLRHLRFYCENNGFKTAFKKVGSRVLVDEAEFFRCVERVNGQTAPTRPIQAEPSCLAAQQ